MCRPDAGPRMMPSVRLLVLGAFFVAPLSPVLVADAEAPRALATQRAERATSAGPSSVRASADAIAKALAAVGLENVRVSWQHNGHLNVRFENRTYRSDAGAVGKAMEVAAAMVAPATQINVVPLRDGILLGRFSVTAGAYLAYREGKLDQQTMRQELEADLDLWEFESPFSVAESSQTINPSRGRFDLRLRPALAYRIGDPADPWQSTPLIRPDLLVTLGTGLRAWVRGRIELEGLGSSVDGALLTKTGYSPGERSLRWTISAGKFRHARYGAYLDAQLSDERDETRFGGTVASMGQDLGDDEFQMYHAYVEREFGELGLTARLSFGRFLETAETGGVVDLERRFGETRLRAGATFGFDANRIMASLSFPLGPSRVGDPAPFRLRISPNAVFDYTTDDIAQEGEALWDAPSLRNFRGELTVPYLAAHPERLLGRRHLRQPDDWGAAPSWEGITGLMRIPTGDAMPDGAIAVGASYFPAAYTFAFDNTSSSIPTFVSFGFLPGLEVNLRYTFFDDRDAVVNGVVYDWTEYDRSLSAHLQVLREDRTRPAVAVGVWDVKGSEDDSPVLGRARYAVASKQLGNTRLHLGLGTGRLEGVFGGVETRMGESLRIMAEYDSRDVNVGLRAQPAEGLNLDVGWLGADEIGGALSYRMFFH